MRAVPAAVNAFEAGGTGAAPMVSAPAAGRVGFFGKVPSRGDFVRRDLPNGFVDAWDLWLQQGIAASRDALGEAWLDSWLCAPIWRFAVPPAACGADGWVGILMPSVDRAGRYFPLTLATMTPAGAPAAAVLAGDWIAALEAVALSALQQDSDFEQFAQAVGGLPAFPAVNVDIWAGGWRARGGAGDATSALAAAAAAVSSSQCIFATRGGGHVASAAWVLPRLPAPQSFVGLIDDRVFGAAAGGMTAPSWMAAPAAAALAASDGQIPAVGLFGGDYGEDSPPAVAGEPPGGAFDRLFDDLPPAAPGQGAFDAPPAAPAAPPTAVAGLHAGDVQSIGAGGVDAMNAPPAPEKKQVMLSHRELFGDDGDDVPAAPSSDLFGDKNGKESAS
ncbi:type VI secretion system-associated protein TagF [Vineibacter terrae]|uniref:Type VI secretion system-associated protein TagF n=1 Tax=Vineibacter terrae TaxID=2586908 RepID=A0A5C8PPP3_9HYPH|nr:type VI secretion system-associated protein TagF [Vineibacter terrae]TXL77145.1 type VI secretion system-associated protein TagF [Vineibacter terrae]